MSYLLKKLDSKKDIDAAIKETQDKVLVLRFGRAEELGTMQQDEIVRARYFNLEKLRIIFK